MKIKINSILIFLLFFSFYTFSSYSEILKEINIIGNNRVSTQTVLDNTDLSLGSDLDTSDLDRVQKKLFKTDFFEEVLLNYNKGKLIIRVKENPLIENFFISGVTNNQREDFLYENLSLGQNKIFSKSLLSQDILKIKNIFADAGYMNAQVEPALSLLPSNNLNLVLNVDRGEKFNVDRIFFIGDKKFKNSELIDEISSSEYGWWKFLSSSSIFSQKRLDYDKYLLREFYLNRGYYDIQIPSVDLDIASSNLLNLTFTIDSGDVYSFGSYNIIDDQNNLSVENINFIKSMVKKSLPKIYSKKKIINIKDDIYNYLNLNNIDFVNLKISENVADDNIVNLIFSFNKSNVKYIDKITVKGNSLTDEEVIRRNINMASGDQFSEYKLDKSKQNLENSQIFKKIEIKKIDKDDELIELEFNVEEQPTGSIAAGIGVGTNESSIGGSLNEKNLFGKGIDVNSNINLGTEKIKGNIGVKFDDFLNSDNKFLYNFYIIDTSYENAGYESTVVGNSGSVEYSIFKDISIELGLGIDFDDISANSSSSQLYKSREGKYSTFKTFYNLKKDTRDRSFNVKNGNLFSFGQSFATPLSDVPYISNNIRNSFYSELSENYVINLKTGFSSINGLDNKDIKFSDRKFISTRNLRGFESLGVGPVDNNNHIGGNYTAYASIASTFPNPLPDKWNAKSLMFFDAGNVWGVDFDKSKDSDEIRSSVGLGLDWISPLGPISFSLSNVLSKANTDKEQSFSFLLGSVF